MTEINFLQVIDSIEEKFLDEIDGERIFASVGKNTKRLFGLKIYTKEGKIRNISFGEIDGLKKTIERM